MVTKIDSCLTCPLVRIFTTDTARCNHPKSYNIDKMDFLQLDTNKLGEIDNKCPLRNDALILRIK